MMIWPEQMANVGRSSPSNALHTYYWAMRAGAVEELEDAIQLDSPARVKLEEMIRELPPSEAARFSTPEAYMAFLMCGSSDQRGYLLSRERRSENQSEVWVMASHSNREGKLKSLTKYLDRQPDGLWRVRVQWSLVEDYHRYLTHRPPMN